MKKIFLIASLSLSIIGCNKDKMVEVNIDPSNVTTPEVKYLFTDALYNLQSESYTEWFYDYSQYILPWTQITVGNNGNSNSATLNQMGATSKRFSVFYDQVGGPIARLRNIIDTQFSATAQASHAYLKAITYPIHIYFGLKVTDLTGSMPYSESLKAFYTTPPLLTPKWDNQEQLLLEWDGQLKDAIAVLSSPVMVNGVAVEQVSIGTQQDLIYSGRIDRWIKFANSLRLKIAVRLIDVDPTSANSIAAEVSNDGRLMNTIEDDFYWYGGSQFFNFEDGISHGVGSKNFIDLLRNNGDPRLRFAFNKNDFNSMVVQGFLDAGVELPSYIKSAANIATVGGKPTFIGWNAPGEPWVRYQGAPNTISGEITASVDNDYFQTSKFQLTIGSATRTFYPTSFFNANIVQPNKWFTYPDVAIISNQYKPNGNFPYRVVYVSAAETQLYLAEFKLRGANISASASDLFAAGVRLSVESMNRTARDLNIPYYNEPYDISYGKAIKLQAGEIDALLQTEAYRLTGDVSRDLEKVQINLIIDHLLTPTDVYVTARRTGLPHTSSTLWPRESFSSNLYPIPRRFIVTEPSRANINYNNTVSAYGEQGFTMSTNLPATLESERIWYDKKSPAWGTRAQ